MIRSEGNTERMCCYVLRNNSFHFLIDLCDQIDSALDLGLGTVA